MTSLFISHAFINEGASVSGNGGQVTAGPTEPITVYAQAKTRHRGRMGGGRIGIRGS